MKITSSHIAPTLLLGALGGLYITAAASSTAMKVMGMALTHFSKEAFFMAFNAENKAVSEEAEKSLEEKRVNKNEVNKSKKNNNKFSKKISKNRSSFQEINEKVSSFSQAVLETLDKYKDILNFTLNYSDGSWKVQVSIFAGRVNFTL